MTTNTQSVSGYNPIKKAIADLSGNTADIIGWLFRVKKGSDMVQIADVRSAMLVARLDESQVYSVSKENAMKKTMSDLKKNKVINQLPSPDKHVMIFQFDKKVIEELSGEMQLRFQKVDSLKFDLSSGVIDCNDDKVKEFAYDRLGIRMKSYDKAQFTNFVNRVVESNLNRRLVRVDDGWYFFDVSLEEQLRKVMKMITLADPKAQILLIPQMKTRENVDVAVEATKESYATLVDEEFKKLEADKIDNDGVLTEKIVKNAIGRLNLLEQQAKLSLIQLEAEGDLLKDAIQRVREFAMGNKAKADLTDEQKRVLGVAKYAIDNGVPKEAVEGILAKDGLTMADISRL